VQPGKTQSQGGNVGVFGSVRALSLDDADAYTILWWRGIEERVK